MNSVSVMPHDHPYPGRPYRIYFALTNVCNRSCPWCSTCSDPTKSTWLSGASYLRFFPTTGPFEVQFEGGEPTLHPLFWDFVELARTHPECRQLVLCTNGVVVPRDRKELTSWLMRFGEHFCIKLSFNHHLCEHDPELLDLARLLRDCVADLGGDRKLIVNVRLRKGPDNDDYAIRAMVESSGLLDCANVFFLQRYGYAANNLDWDLPYLAGKNFCLINPDGTEMGTDLIARSEAMRMLP